MNKREKLPPATKEASIDFILANISLKPRTFGQFVRSFLSDFGLGFLFVGMSEVFVILGALIFAWLVFVRDFTNRPTIEFMERTILFVYFMAFVTAPLFYSLLYSLTIWKERLEGTFELKMTLKLSLRELLIMRMLAFSILALCLSVVVNVFCWLQIEQSISLVTLLSISFASLFIFVTVQLYFEHKLNGQRYYWLSATFWLVITVILTSFQSYVSLYLQRLPLVIVVGFAVVFMVLFIMQLRQHYYQQEEGAITYVNS